MNYQKLEEKIDDLILQIGERAGELDPEVSGEDDLINELERMQDDLISASARIERLKELENRI